MESFFFLDHDAVAHTLHCRCSQTIRAHQFGAVYLKMFQYAESCTTRLGHFAKLSHYALYMSYVPKNYLDGKLVVIRHPQDRSNNS